MHPAPLGLGVDELENVFDFLSEIDVYEKESSFFSLAGNRQFLPPDYATRGLIGKPFLPEHNREALRTSSLVCKAWRYPAQQRLFRYVSLHRSWIYEADLVDRMPPILSGIASPLEAGRAVHAKVKEDRQPQVPLRQLTISVESQCQEKNNLNRAGSQRQIFADPSFYQWIKRCPHLRSIYVETPLLGLWDSNFSLPEEMNKLNALNTITTFHLSNYSDTALSRRQMLQIFSFMPSLIHLSIEEEVQKWENMRPSKQPQAMTDLISKPPPFSLRTFIYSAHQSTELVDVKWILSNSLDTLQDLHLVIWRVSQCKCLDSLFQQGLGKTVKRYTIQIDWHDREAADEQLKLINYFPNATEVGLTVFTTNMIETISSLPKGVTDLSLIYHNQGGGWLRVRRELCRMLRAGSRGRLAQLKSLTLEVRSWIEEEVSVFHKTFAQDLHSACAAGGIQFQFLLDESNPPYYGP